MSREDDRIAVTHNRARYQGLSEVQIWNEDCITGMEHRLKDASVHLVVSSIPFGALFMYSGKLQDVGNNQDGVDLHAGQFGLHMRFFLNQLFRVMTPGSIFCCHVQQLDTTKIQHGYMGMRDFRGAVIMLCQNHGFIAHGEVAIPKNPQAVAQRRKKHSLMFVTGRRDSRKLAPTANDYVLFFRMPGEGQEIQGLYDVNKNPHGWFAQEEWIKWASGVWDDIRETDVLEGWRSARETDEEKHVCPLQLEVIRRCIYLYSAPGQVVFDPFVGIGSTPWVCIETGRNCVAFDLKESYWRISMANTERAKALYRSEQKSLFVEEGL